jgi:pyruvate-ferredoxin/flavodoxin oxidoreductase
MVVLGRLPEMEEDDREGKFPLHLGRRPQTAPEPGLGCQTIVESCEERRDFWIMLRDLAGVEPSHRSKKNVEEKIRAEVVGKIAQG